MVETVFDGNRITVDLVDEKYRLSLFDNNYHFTTDIELDVEQMLELKDAFDALKLENND